MTERRNPDGRYPSVPERITWTTGFRCATDKDILGVLSTFADFRTGKGVPVSLNKIVARAKLKRRRVQYALYRLEADRWVVPRRRHRHATAWDINLDRLATNWVGATVVASPDLSATGCAQLSATACAQTPDLSATACAQPPDLSATACAPFPCTYGSPVQTSPVPAHGANAPPPQQLSFGPLEPRPPEPRTSTAAADVWTDVLAIIETQIPRHLFVQWWQPSVLIEDQGSVLVVRANNGRDAHDLAVHWISKHFAGVLAEALAAVRPGVRVEWCFAARVLPQKRKFG
jgi:hypothetical protein